MSRYQQQDYNQGYNYDQNYNQGETYDYDGMPKRKSNVNYHRQQDSAYKLPDNGDNFNWNEYYGVDLNKNQQNYD